MEDDMTLCDLKITRERARELVQYDPDTGEFRWRVARRGTRKGSVVGSVDNRGYWLMRLDGRAYQAHRLAWFWMLGMWPEFTIDHINGNPLDNSWANLRAATWSQNLANRGPNNNNTSGVKGVWWNKRRLKWQAGIMVNRKAIHLGYFSHLHSARAAYDIAAAHYFGAFAKAS